GNAPPHYHHEEETDGKEQKGDNAVLNSNDFVVGREDVFLPKRRIVMMISVVIRMAGVAAHDISFKNSVTLRPARRFKNCRLLKTRN
ncbi:MAG: hypothetical protein WBE58_24405, partial [Verrucomicrobiales bacterium]